jgi:hypothetical protein
LFGGYVVKRISLLAIAFILLAAAGLGAGSNSIQQPVYVYLYARVTDHVNIDLGEDRLRRILPLIERYRKAHPDAHVSATILFSGAVSEALAGRNGQTHILDYVRDFINRGIIEPGYDGTDEPTYKRRPFLDFAKTKTAEDRWLARQDVADKLLTEARDPLTGDPLSGKEGGLKRMQSAFGHAVCITGVTLGVRDLTTGSMPELGSDSEIVNDLRRYDTSAIMFGIPAANPAHVPEFAIWAAAFSKAMSPVPETSPELYWHDNVLRTSETSETDNRLFRAMEGPEAFKALAGKLDRSRIRVIHVELGSVRSYLTPPFIRPTSLAYAYDHPEHPMLPQEAHRAAADVDAAWAKEDALLNWLAGDFFSVNSGSHFVSSTDLNRMAEPSTGYDITTEGLRAALAEAVKSWGDDPAPPKYLYADHHYLSLADLFQVMTDELAELNRSDKLPRTVRVVPVFGPFETTRDRGLGQGQVTVASVARACAGLTGRLHDDAWSQVPKNFIPLNVKVDGIDLNAAQFLRLMAEALVTPSPETKLKVKMTEMFWGRDATYMRTRSIRDEGGAWTFKPALVKIPSAGI